MKLDVVIAWYAQEDLWPLVAWGLNENRESIHRVLIVNDARWTPAQRALLLATMATYDAFPKHVLLEHKHEEFGSHRSIRQGAQHVNTGWWVHIDGDIILAPGSLEALSNKPERGIMRCGVMHDVRRDLQVSDLANCPIERADKRLDKDVCDWVDVRDGYIFSHAQDYFAIGGHDLLYPDYGCCDYDIAMRWMMHFGEETIEMAPDAISYHLGGAHVQHPTDSRNLARFKRMAVAYCAWQQAEE